MHEVFSESFLVKFGPNEDVGCGIFVGEVVDWRHEIMYLYMLHIYMYIHIFSGVLVNK